MPEEPLAPRAEERGAGFYGKVPVRGDFVGQRLSRDFVEPWDEWLQASILACREHFGEAWLDIYLTSPIWRFVLAAGVCGPRPAIGVLMPNVDSVGRVFPLVVASALEPTANPFSALVRARPWFAEVERLALETLEEGFELETFDRALSTLEAPPVEPAAAALPSPEAPGAPLYATGPRLLYPLRDGEFELQDGTFFARLLDAGVATLFEAYSLWATHGSDRVAPVVLGYAGLPPESEIPAFFDGRWT